MESERVELQNSLVNEISKGLEQVKQLKVSSSNNDQERVVERMLSCYEEALSILTGRARAPQEQCQSVITSSSDPPATSPCVIKVTQSEAARRGGYKRKTREVTRTSREVALDDGYNWRKYGEKDLLGSKFPRSYFRCSNRHTESCKATKQVQRSDNDPNILDVTYIDEHTCKAVALTLNPISSLIASGSSSTRVLSDQKSSN